LPAELTPRFVAQALGLLEPAGPDVAFTAVSTDSRTLPSGALFVPIRGERFDGHDFIPAALERGARGIVASRPVAAAALQVSVFAVSDTLAAFQTLGAAWRRRFAIPVVVVAGSVGKTTTKDLLAAALSGRWRVLKTEASRNGDVGIPMTLLELRPEHEAAVVEIGIDEVGAMARHLALVRPTAAVVTAIGAEHLEKLRDLETVAREESLALEQPAGQGGLAIVNLDDPWLAPLFERLAPAVKLGFTLEAVTARPRVLRGRVSEAFEELQVEGEAFRLPLPGAHNASNLLAAIAVATGIGLSANEIRHGLTSFRPAQGRSEVRRLPGGPLVLCDYYNANPTSMAAAFELFASLPARGARWACLGDMLELGPGEERLHRELAGPLMRAGVSGVLLAGPRMAALADELGRRGFQGRVAHFERLEDLAAAFARDVHPDDTVLVKGSRGMRMERTLPAAGADAGRER
jgi:UDP-N-acetylmuramoyl-tripeptide--D-alanyl-D-alanine ligase